MSKTMMTIPKVINVGYQSRTDTYTGKLAYVVYTDEKGVLRKEASWKSWCAKNIKKDEFKNEPMEGFVLNKKVGDHNWGWNGRKAWCRIYDPRGFEFEITVENLLLILEECTSVKGKGLEGELVYAWDRADLVLLPVSSQEYQSCRDFTDMKTQKVTKDEMKEGFTYLTKDMQEVIYMGRNIWYEPNFNGYHYGYHSSAEITNRIIDKGYKHIFCRLKCPKQSNWSDKIEDAFYPESGFTKLAKVLSDKPHPDFPELFDKFKKTVNGSPAKTVKVSKIPCPNLNFTGYHHTVNSFLMEGDYVYFCVIDIRQEGNHHSNGPYHTVYRLYQGSKPIKIENNQVVFPGAIERYYDVWGKKDTDKIKTAEEIQSLQFCKVFIENEAGDKFDLCSY